MEEATLVANLESKMPSVKAPPAPPYPLGSRKISVRVNKSGSTSHTGVFMELPMEVRPEMNKKVSSTWIAGTTNIKRGLTPIEEKWFMGDIIGSNSKSEHWEGKLLEYWKNFEVPIPYGDDGLTLEIGLARNESENAQFVEEVPYVPLILMDYIKYHYCRLDSRVAFTPDELLNVDIYSFYIVDKSVEKAGERKTYELRKEADKLFLRMTSEKATTETKVQVDHILRLAGKSMDGDALDREIRLKEYMISNTTEFMVFATDENLSIKAFVNKCITIGELRREGNTIFYGEIPIGSDKDNLETIAYLKNPANSDVYNTLAARLEANAQ